MNDQLQKKIDFAIHLIQSAAPEDGTPIEVAYSGGKDSDVILQLVKESGIPYRAIYKNTTIDPPGTIQHAEKMGCEIIRPKQTFFQLIEKKGYPHKKRRFCCEILKEYKILDKAVLGIRREESSARKKRYVEPTECRIYSKTEYAEHFFPILDWSSSDVEEFIKDRKITCAPVYYDANGRFHVERRLGCMACPLAYRKHRIADFKRYPGLIKAYLRAGKKYMDTHPQSVACELYDDQYEYFARNLFYDSQEEFDNANHTIFGKPLWKRTLEDYFNIKLD